VVAIWERDEATCAAAGAEVDGLACVTDVRDAAAVEAALAATIERFGRVDVLVNNAGGVFQAPFLATSDNGFEALYRANLKHVLVCSHRVANRMVEQGGGGSIISVTSIEGVRAAPGYAAYAAAKAGVINLTKTLALELAPHGIRVNCLAPDITMTEGLQGLLAERGEAVGGGDRYAQVVPMGRAGHVDELAGAAVFLASSLGSYVTGQTIHVDGGTHAASGWYHPPGSDDYVLGPPPAANPQR
jgi:NAD(P)-dependent dehydrogenase (short-subunit alcohol dehydrogenase family)